ncbi:Selenoprotein O and cysteine-containing homologs [plant metagenome]|uniref:Selenoprotein O and cysteine-containing homologs n=1 Tax=plant metagenome TaxID=1297885 RepID=A0A484TSJ2_9ZZZZ
MTLAKTLDQLSLRNSFAALPDSFCTRLAPRPFQHAPRLLHANADAAALIGLDPAALQTPEFLAVVSGSAPLPGGDPLAAVYSGHQFGVWAGQLGDGRAHLLGEVQGPSGNWELQLKGSGLTPYSRMGDGRAVLRSSVREYLASEAMHGLGIPTTRALAIAVSDDAVVRETVETAAVVTRMAPSFVRFGSFEHWASRKDMANLRILADYVIDTFYPECRDAPAGEPQAPGADVVRMLAEVTRRTGTLMADWLSVGFCHGVMNTDNMSILGLTLDYGPYGFMDGFNAGHICNHTDSQGRYAWNVQPSVAHWNLQRLATALHPLVPGQEDALGEALDGYEAAFLSRWHGRVAAKLGLAQWQAEDEALFDELLRLMHGSRADFTQTFRRLALAPEGQAAPFLDLFIDREATQAWLAQYAARLARDGRDPVERVEVMNRNNPLYVLRNHLAETAIRAAAEGDAGELDNLLRVLRNPWQEHENAKEYAALAPDWASDLEVSCSS